MISKSRTTTSAYSYDVSADLLKSLLALLEIPENAESIYICDKNAPGSGLFIFKQSGAKIKVSYDIKEK
jgi:hypothetical protein